MFFTIGLCYIFPFTEAALTFSFSPYAVGGVQHLSVTAIPMAMLLSAAAATQDHARGVIAAPPPGWMHIRN